MADIIFPDGTLLKDLVGNRNVFSSDPSTSVGAGEIIYQTTAETLKVNTQTVDPTTNPIWTSVGGGGVTDHGVLTGLTDDDHTHYLLVGGSRAMTGNLNMGTNNITGIGATSHGAAATFATTDGGTFTFKALTTTILSFTKTLITFAKELAMSGNKITGLGDPTVNGDAVRYEHIAADDHTQYFLADGSRAMTGDIDLNDYDISLNHGSTMGISAFSNVQFLQAGEVGIAYFSDIVSADSYTDRTTFYEGDAISEINKIKGDRKGRIDHSSLPTLAQRKIKYQKKNEETGNITEVEEDGRDIGAMVSILTVAIQQLTSRIEELEAKLQINED